MKCTACSIGKLSPSYIDGSLLCHLCDNCHGQWIYLTDYLKWQSSTNQKSTPSVNVELHIDETKRALICPVSGTLMTKYKFLHDSNNKIDLSAGANAFWLDKGEWELLKNIGLAHEINSVFTSAWQANLKSKHSKHVFETMYAKEFGEENYEKLKGFKVWLDEQSTKGSMLAYLTDSNPYSGS